MAVVLIESQLQEAVIECAQALGWRVAHFRPAKTDKGWRTAVSADGKGFPDLVLVGRGRVVFAELKDDHNSLSVEQLAWFEALRDVEAEVYIWRPGQWRSGEIEAVLRLG